MALKDRFERIVSYFDTDDASEVVETPEAEGAREIQPQSVSSSLQQPQQEDQRQSLRPTASQPQRPQRERAAVPISVERPQPASQQDRQLQEEKIKTMSSRSNDVSVPSANGTTIALKFPRKYEDAQEIVDLLINNECVLIDFQYMLEAQARRCLDFIDGASRVLYGNLQKVGSSMYLLTPKDVVVNMEEMNLSNANQDVSFDYDMKRR